VDTDQFHPARDRARWRSRLGIRDGTALILHVGRLAPEKNLDVLVAAWSLARATLGAQARFVIAGEGPLEAGLGERLPWAARLGFLERDDLADLYAAADVCVLPSATETCGLVALEAMATGLAVIAADAGGFRESIRHGQTGLLAPAADARAFAAHVVTLVLEHDRRRTVGIAARDFALTRTETAEDDILLSQYRLLIGSPAAGARACAA
jgi:glycosyltransferase involved in cell wall biosynthesis